MAVIDALADPVRRDLLVRMANAPRSVTDLMEGQAISRPAISRHLRVLRETGLVTVTSSGRHRLHELDRDALTPVRELLPRRPRPRALGDELELALATEELRDLGAPARGEPFHLAAEPTGLLQQPQR